MNLASPMRPYNRRSSRRAWVVSRNLAAQLLRARRMEIYRAFETRDVGNVGKGMHDIDLENMLT